MKKFLMMMLAVMFLVGCSSEMTAEEFKKDDNKSWQDYLAYGEKEYATLSVGGITPYPLIVDLGDGNIGMGDRELATEVGRDAFGAAYFKFWYNMGFYFDVEEAGNLAVGSLADCVSEYTPDTGNLAVDLMPLLAKPENSHIDIGDEVFKINFYTDSTKTELMDTFTFIL